MRPGVTVLLAAASAAVCGCAFDFGFDGTRYRCGAGDRCPAGQICVGGFCEVGSDPDAGDPDAPDDADGGATDAAPDAPMPGAACGTLSLLRDDFATAGNGPFFSPFMGASSTVTESAGRLVIDLMPTGESYAGYESFHLYDLHGGELVAEVVETAADATILEVRNHLGNKAQLALEGTTIYAGLYSVANPGTLAQRTWQSNERFWRIREESGDMVWEVSTDGSSWSLLHRRTLPFDVSHVSGVVSAGGTVTALARSSFEQVNPTATTQPYCAADTLRDDFAVAGGLYPLWYVYQNAGCTVTESGGNLVLTYQTGSTSSFCGMNGSHLYDFTRGTGITVDANTFPTIANFNSYLQASTPAGGNSLEMELDGSTLYLRMLVNGSPASNTALTFNRTMHRWWRLRGDGSSAIWETSPDATTWTERHRATAPFPLSPLDVNLGAGRYGSITGPITVTIPGVNAP